MLVRTHLPDTAPPGPSSQVEKQIHRFQTDATGRLAQPTTAAAFARRPESVVSIAVRGFCLVGFVPHGDALARVKALPSSREQVVVYIGRKSGADAGKAKDKTFVELKLNKDAKTLDLEDLVGSADITPSAGKKLLAAWWLPVDDIDNLPAFHSIKLIQDPKSGALRLSVGTQPNVNRTKEISVTVFMLVRSAD